MGEEAEKKVSVGRAGKCLAQRRDDEVLCVHGRADKQRQRRESGEGATVLWMPDPEPARETLYPHRGMETIRGVQTECSTCCDSAPLSCGSRSGSMWTG